MIHSRTRIRARTNTISSQSIAITLSIAFGSAAQAGSKKAPIASHAQKVISSTRLCSNFYRNIFPMSFREYEISRSKFFIGKIKIVKTKDARW